jgi:enamine deaminase RidA (YjgF/YER057c/UK114 family)
VFRVPLNQLGESKYTGPMFDAIDSGAVIFYIKKFSFSLLDRDEDARIKAKIAVGKKFSPTEIARILPKCLRGGIWLDLSVDNEPFDNGGPEESVIDKEYMKRLRQEKAGVTSSVAGGARLPAAAVNIDKSLDNGGPEDKLFNVSLCVALQWIALNIWGERAPPTFNIFTAATSESDNLNDKPLDNGGPQSDISVSLVDFGTYRMLLGSITAQRGVTSEKQLDTVFENIRAALYSYSCLPSSLVRMAVSVRNLGQREEVLRKIEELCNPDNMPAVSFIAQPPSNGAELAVEFWAVPHIEGVEIEHPFEELGKMVIVKKSGLRMAFIEGISPVPTSGGNPQVLEEQSYQCYQEIHQMLQRHGFNPEHILRYWIYLEDITGPQETHQNYAALNRGRTRIFSELDFGKGILSPKSIRVLRHLGRKFGRKWECFPASTGIGTCEGIVGLGTICLDASAYPQAQISPLENYRQTPVYQYGFDDNRIRDQPKFARAIVLVIDGKKAIIFISGTASILAGKNAHEGNVVAQAEETSNNIQALISLRNLRQYGLKGFNGKLSNVQQLKVYIKHPQDYPQVRQVIERRFGRIPITYNNGDVCRQGLLTEFEGIAILKKTNPFCYALAVLFDSLQRLCSVLITSKNLLFRCGLFTILALLTFNNPSFWLFAVLIAGIYLFYLIFLK